MRRFDGTGDLPGEVQRLVDGQRAAGQTRAPAQAPRPERPATLFYAHRAEPLTIAPPGQAIASFERSAGSIESAQPAQIHTVCPVARAP